MSWSRRGLLTGLAALPLSGCFRPMLADNGPAAALRGRIALPEIDGRFGYFLVRSLEDRLGRPDAPRYRLLITSDVSEAGLAVSQDNAVTRITLTATAEWSLIPEGGTDAILKSSVRSQSGYSATASLFATRQTRLDIERRLAKDLGERIARSVLAQAGRLPA